MALLIATDSYADLTFSELRAPRRDVAELRDVLAEPDIGGFVVQTRENTVVRDLRVDLERFFSGAGREDLLLVYFSGHGIKDESGDLHLAVADTERTLLESTGVSAAFVRRLIDRSPARKVVLWLDCCYGGAFPAGTTRKSAERVDVIDQLTTRSGRGCSVMTASTHLGYAFESNAGREGRSAALPSIFTRMIVEGLRTGEADLNGDGLIDAAELYSYVFERVREVTPDQTPTRNDQLAGEVYLARNRTGLVAGTPRTIRQDLLGADRGARLKAVAELERLATRGTVTEQDIAIETLRRLADRRAQVAAEDDQLGQAAQDALHRLRSSTEDTRDSAEELPAAGSRSHRRVLAFGGAGLLVAVAVSVPWFMEFTPDTRGGAPASSTSSRPATTSGTTAAPPGPHLMYSRGDELTYPYRWLPLEIPQRINWDPPAAKAWWKMSKQIKSLHTELRVQPDGSTPEPRYVVGGKIYSNTNCLVRVEVRAKGAKVAKELDGGTPELDLPGPLPAIGPDDSIVIDATIRVNPDTGDSCAGELRWDDITLNVVR
jgi:hypothetical protein